MDRTGLRIVVGRQQLGIGCREQGCRLDSFDSGDDAGADMTGAGADAGGERGRKETFMVAEAQRADKARQMQELGFSPESILGLLGIATDDGREADGENEALEAFQEETAVPKYQRGFEIGRASKPR